MERISRQYAANFLEGPISAVLEYTGIVDHRNRADRGSSIEPGEFSIRIVGAVDQDGVRAEDPRQIAAEGREDCASSQEQSGLTDFDREQSPVPLVDGSSSPASSSGSSANPEGSSGVDPSPRRHDMQQAARWVEQVLPFSLLLFVVFVRQHLQGFLVTIWIVAVLFRSNDILCKQTALKGDRSLLTLFAAMIFFALQVFGVYWLCKTEDIVRPLMMLPPREIPSFWQAIFLIILNDTMVRQAAMTLKCLILMCYKNSNGPGYRRQGQILNLVEYLLLLYRALLPTPVWYRFFLNKEYGTLFSALITGLYLTIKLTSVVDKVKSCFAALKALSHKQTHYGFYATADQVAATGDICAICQEKIQSPILLWCKHIFCEDCVSEWFERERTCPLCRATVKPVELRSFSDGSTSLFMQLT